MIFIFFNHITSLQGNEPFIPSPSTPPSAHLTSSRYPPVGLIFNAHGPSAPPPPPPPPPSSTETHHQHHQMSHHQHMPAVQQPTVYSHPEISGPHPASGIARMRSCQRTVIVRIQNDFYTFFLHFFQLKI